MGEFSLILCITLGCLASKLNGQQMYSGNSVQYCNNTDEKGPSPAFLYTCNGEKPSCQAFLIYRSQPFYDSVTTISNLTSSNPLELARINNISSSMLLPNDKEVIVPVTCSCSGNYYQANTSYVITTEETYFTIARNVYKGLSTCDSLVRENIYGALDLHIGLVLQVPLRCACPTSNQIKDGIKFLLTYLVTGFDRLPNISGRFNVSSRSVAYANGFTEENPTLFPFTTILIPLPTEPLNTQTETHYPPPVVSAKNAAQRNAMSKKGLFIGIGSGVALAVLCAVLFMVLLQKKCCTDEPIEKSKMRKKKSILPKDFSVRTAEFDRGLKVHKYEELLEATENFGSQNRLSDSVYRGVLGGKTVAIKKVSADVLEEVKILKKVNHFNLIRLCGVCDHNGAFYLTYEFMENGSLKGWLGEKSGSYGHSWNNRLRIALDIANGLHYLHNFTELAYVHGNLNSSNVLLNKDLRATITGFSLARSAERGEKESWDTRSVIRTRGHMAPEYLESGIVTPKMDVYAFGVILLELITGRTAVFEQDGEEILLSDAVLSIVQRGNSNTEIGNLTDPRLHIKHPLGFIIGQTELALRLVKLGAACLEREAIERLSMVQVVSTLVRIQFDAQISEHLDYGVDHHLDN